MNGQREARRNRLSEARASWEDQGGEVAAGKLKVLEKFFTPLPRSAICGSVKSRGKEGGSRDGARDPYYTESFSSSSSPWSSESNFGDRAGSSEFHSQVLHSRSCNDLSAGRGRDGERMRGLAGKEWGAPGPRRVECRSTERINLGRCGVGSAKLKKDPGHGKVMGLKEGSGRVRMGIKMDGGRRAKSMEALAEKGMRKGREVPKGKVLEEKQRFSQFLNEITVQVMSPSNLSSLGVKEGQSVGSREPRKNSSTDSSSSRGKRSQGVSVVERQELRRKGKGKIEPGPKSELDARTGSPGSWRSREMSTSPDSGSSSARQRGGRVVPRSGSTTGNNQATKPKACSPHGTLKGREMAKGGSQFVKIGRDREDESGRRGRILQGKTQHVDNIQNRLISKHSQDTAVPVPIIPPPDWWGDPEFSQPSENNMETLTGTFSRIKDSFPQTQATNELQEKNLHSCVQNKNLVPDRDSLNQKITELLEHLVRAQNTICALEKLNVSSLLSHPSPVEVSHPTLDAASQSEGPKDLNMSADVSPEAYCRDSGVNVNWTAEEVLVEIPAGPKLTAFSPWSPRRERTLPILHQLYNSTESECSLEGILPTCKLLSPRFPYLGESFSDDRKDGGSSDGSDTRAEQRVSRALKCDLPPASLLPAHRFLPRSQRTRPSSSESSGDDLLLSWGHGLSQGSGMDYLSAQKILDTLLGLTSSGRSPTPHPENSDVSSPAGVPLMGGYHTRAVLGHTNHPMGTDLVSRVDSEHGFHAGYAKGSPNPSGGSPHPESLPRGFQIPLRPPKDDPDCGSHPSDSKETQLPSRKSPLPRGVANTVPPPSGVDETGFPSLGVWEVPSRSSILSESPRPQASVYSPGCSLDPHGHPSETHREVERSNRGRGKSPRTPGGMEARECQVTSRSKITSRSKVTSSKMRAQGLGDDALVDSTLL
ncbi:uncharacterized protein LOC142465694 isoform X1 [Ascaphus truei]|uniref:uncharacterized protein LOC142465694 isoform X1 n=1 Tax=Ascaphus truei TaxID=8439 RepID=UPI003F5A760F